MKQHITSEAIQNATKEYLKKGGKIQIVEIPQDKFQTSGERQVWHSPKRHGGRNGD